jgi:hypothetical protein
VTTCLAPYVEIALMKGTALRASWSFLSLELPSR